jgi:uncharacterized membrane protein
VAWLRSIDAVWLWHSASFCILSWLGIFFGRTLARGKVPLIEQIARVSEPDITPDLSRYTRRLTAVWCVYFFIGALSTVAFRSAPLPIGLCVGLGSGALFVVEHWVRHRIFPGRWFPGLAQQVRDTWKVWH